MKIGKIISIYAFTPLFLWLGFAAKSNETFTVKANSNFINAWNVDEEKDKITVFSYKDVFFKYYEQALNTKTIEGKEFIDFDTFCENYYVSGLDIKSYTASWKYIDIDNFETYDYNSNMPMLTGSSSNDAEYILSSDTYNVTPYSEFKNTSDDKMPIYDLVTSYLYSKLNVGDIIYETRTIFWNAGHNAMITSTDKQGVNQSGGLVSYYETIEAVGGGVQYGFLDDNRIVAYGVKILRVKNATTSKINNAVYFMKRQLGKTYSLNINRTNSSIDSNEWYCSELVWAAYNYSNIDLCELSGVKHGETGNTGGPLPYTIYCSDNTYEILLSEIHIRMSILSKSGSVWTIRLKNPNGFSTYCKYNSKMCFLEDASNWSNLNDLVSITIPSYSYKDVQISENWYATSIVCGWEDLIYRYVTYADTLMQESKSMMTRYTQIEL